MIIQIHVLNYLNKIKLYLNKMGINKLLFTLKSISNCVNISTYENKTLGVDISCWIHRAFYCLLNSKVSGKN